MACLSDVVHARNGISTASLIIAFIITVYYSKRYGNYVLSFVFSYLFSNSWFLAIIAFYSIMGNGLQTLLRNFQSGFLGFAIIGIIFGTVSVASIKLRSWLGKEDEIEENLDKTQLTTR